MRDLYPELRDLKPGEHPFAIPLCPPVRHDADRAAKVLERDAARRSDRRWTRSSTGTEIEAGIAALPEPVVINCTGLGSRELMGDDQLIPIKGQLRVLLPQPEIDYTVLEDHYYMFPGATASCWAAPSSVTSGT